MNCNKLHKLYLSSAKISDINVLEKVNFPELVKLDLSSNRIRDISVFQKIKFDRLELLNISQNKVNYKEEKNREIKIKLKEFIKDFEC